MTYIYSHSGTSVLILLFFLGQCVVTVQAVPWPRLVQDVKVGNWIILLDKDVFEREVGGDDIVEVAAGEGLWVGIAGGRVAPHDRGITHGDVQPQRVGLPCHGVAIEVGMMEEEDHDIGRAAGEGGGNP